MQHVNHSAKLLFVMNATLIPKLLSIINSSANGCAVSGLGHPYRTHVIQVLRSCLSKGRQAHTNRSRRGRTSRAADCSPVASSGNRLGRTELSHTEKLRRAYSGRCAGAIAPFAHLQSVVEPVLLTVLLLEPRTASTSRVSSELFSTTDFTGNVQRLILHTVDRGKNCVNGASRSRQHRCAKGLRALTSRALPDRPGISRRRVPNGVVNVVTNSVPDAAAIVEALIDHPFVKRINFTGSTRVGSLLSTPPVISSRCFSNSAVRRPYLYSKMWRLSPMNSLPSSLQSRSAWLRATRARQDPPGRCGRSPSHRNGWRAN